MKKILFIVMFCFIGALGIKLQACTSAIISGKITPDGRPLLWKNRDTNFLENSVQYFQGERYAFVGVVNCAELYANEIWMGTNETGFSLMNTQSYNLVTPKKGEDRGPENGRVMYRALEICANVDDFKHFLDTIAKPSGIEANFGVIDAKGNALFFEVTDHSYTVFDANNTKDAPYGYIVRTNFSFSGDRNEGAGYVRFMDAEHHLMPAATMNCLTPSWVINHLSRSFSNQMLNIDLRKEKKQREWFVDQDFIPRKSTGSAVVIQGVKKGENPELTTMWTVLGYPPVSVAVPIWVKGGSKNLPRMMVRDKHLKVAPLGAKVHVLRSKIFAYHQGMGTSHYLHWNQLYNTDKTGFMQLLAPVERNVFKLASVYRKRWYQNGKISSKELETLYCKIETYVMNQYNELFDL